MSGNRHEPPIEDFLDDGMLQVHRGMLLGAFKEAGWPEIERLAARRGRQSRGQRTRWSDSAMPILRNRSAPPAVPWHSSQPHTSRAGAGQAAAAPGGRPVKPQTHI